MKKVSKPLNISPLFSHKIHAGNTMMGLNSRMRYPSLMDPNLDGLKEVLWD